ncbi:MAG: AAA family ATPase [Fimbriimonadaceae bacterium]|nr:AAA family ATPase [Fimbriimonadaceae bacterium]QYK56793.1 MAG: AAA family ATPase [Fimbriimonadaceae bacterium]
MDPETSRALTLLARLSESIPAEDAKAKNYVDALRVELENSVREAGEKDKALEAYSEAYEKLTAPANRVGAFLRSIDGGLVVVALGETEYVTNIDPKVEVEKLVPGTRVRLNDAYAVVGVLPDHQVGPVTRVSEVLADGRLRVGADAQNQQGRLIEASQAIQGAEIKEGDEVRLDASGRLATEHFARREARDYLVEEIPEIPWSQVGGQEEAITLIRETIENPLLYPELYAKYNKKPVKGVLLYGPPGCGKTLIGKATAYNLAKEYSKRLDHPVKECFMHISGPKILNMWLGETERMVREIFAAARARAKEGQLVVIFIDEAESILRTRSSGRWLNISNTVVPQFCAEMDGMVELENVVIIITSNRPDYIDPAVLRPERIDRKVKVKRPGLEESKDIFGIYLNEALPLDQDFVRDNGGAEPARKAMVEDSIEFLWRSTKETEFVRVSLKNGNSDTLYWRDFVSGALLKSVVDRAKDSAIRRAIASPSCDTGITDDDLKEAIKAEFRENEIFPKNDSLDDWLKLLDLEPEAVVSVRPVRTSAEPRDTFGRRIV